MADEPPKDQPQGQPESENDAQYPAFFEFLETKEGHELASRVIALFEGIQKATIEAGVEQKKREVEFHHSTMRLWLKIQAGAISVLFITAGVLAWHGNLDATVATLMATLFGYFLGRPLR
jgi:hypothetical protein